MCVLKKGASDVRKTFSTAIIIAFLAITFAPTLSFAQKQSKPQLVPVKLDETTSEQKAIEVAKKLAPKYFNLKSDKKKIEHLQIFRSLYKL